MSAEAVTVPAWLKKGRSVAAGIGVCPQSVVDARSPFATGNVTSAD